ncbi:MAG: hypothetical protein U0795_19585 [Pirellulales bacterium]
MSLRFYMDVHVPVVITQQLRRRGIDVLTSQEDDLLPIAHHWQMRGEPFAGIMYAHQLGTSIGQFIEDLELIASCCLKDELASQVIFLPLV